MFSLFDLKKTTISKTILWSVIVHLAAALVLYLYPKPAPKLDLTIPFHQVKLVKLKKRRSQRQRKKKKKVRKKNIKKKKRKKKTVKPKLKKAVRKPIKKPPSPPPKEEEKPKKKVSVETSHFQFIYYLDIIKNKILMDWNPDVGFLEPGMEVELKASFRIQKNGDITDVMLIKGSFDDSLNQSALKAVLAARPMPPLPDMYDEDYLTVNFTFFLRGTYK